MSSQEQNKKVNIVNSLTEDQARKCATIERSATAGPIGKDIVKSFKNGKITPDIFDAVYESLMDPNKFAKKSYQHFFIALGKCKFPNGAKHARTFLRALSGPNDLRKYAEDFMAKLADPISMELTEYSEKNALKRIKELSQVSETKEFSLGLGARVDSILATGTTGSEVANVLRQENTKHWLAEKAPEEVSQNANKLMVNRSQLMKRALWVESQLDDLDNSPKDDPKRREVLNQELAQIDESIDQCTEDLNELHYKKIVPYLGREMSRFREIQYFSKNAGFDLNTATDLQIWYLESKNDPALRGFTVNAKGLAAKKLSKITIQKLSFGDVNDDDPESTGQLMITYRMPDGHDVTTTTKNFLNIVNGLEAYTEIADLDDLNNAIAPALHYTSLKTGDVFSTKKAIDVNSKGEIVYDTSRFSIKEIVERNGKKYIALDKVITKTPKKWLSQAVDESMYFDRMQQEYTLGEFAKLVKQHNYAREVTDSDNLDSIMHARAKLSGLALTIPKTGQKTNVTYRAKDGQLRAGELSLQPDGKFELTETGEPKDPITGFERRRPLKKIQLDQQSLLEMAEKNDLSDERAELESAKKEAEAAAAEELKDAAEKAKSKPPAYRKEALPYEQIYKQGDIEQVESDYLSNLWGSTYVLSTMDIWEMGKAMWDYYKRRFDRRQKNRYSSVGKKMPFFGPDMARIQQGAETEQMNNFKDSMQDFGVDDIRDIMRTTNNRDELKATFVVMSGKGQIRWDDISLWQNINKFVAPDKQIPIPKNGDPYTVLGLEEATRRGKPGDADKTGFDFLQEAIDSMWGRGGYSDWYAQNKSNYESNARRYFAKGKELENVAGGHQKRLATLLEQHQNGEFADPHEYEGLIWHMIDNGKADMDDKLYYMVMGVTTQNSNGEALLSFDRIAHLNSELLPKFPMLEYMTANVPRKKNSDPNNTEVESYKWTKDDFKSWADMFNKNVKPNGDYPPFKPNPDVQEFMWKVVLPSPPVKNRINKAFRNAENIDHDDMYAYFPPASENLITDSCKGLAGAGKRFFTVEGYMNAFPGFNQYIRSMAESDSMDKLMEGIRSYVRMESIMSDKWERGDKTYQRFGDSEWNKPTVASGKPPIAYTLQLNALVQKIVAAYDNPELSELAKIIYAPMPEFTEDQANEERKYNSRLQKALVKFGPLFNKVVKDKDRGQLMKNITLEENLTGMSFNDVKGKQERQAKLATENATSLE